MKKLLNLILSLLMVIGLTTNVYAGGGDEGGWGGPVGTVYKVKDVNETDPQTFDKDGKFFISLQGTSPEEQLTDILNSYLDKGYVFADDNMKVPETPEEFFIFNQKYGIGSQQNMPEHTDEQTIKLKHNTFESIIEQPSGVTHYKFRRVEHIFVGEENKNYTHGYSGLHTYTEYAIYDAVTNKMLKKDKRDIQVQFPSYKPPVVDGWQADKTEIEAQTYYDYNYPDETVTYTKTGTPEKTFKTYISAYDLVANGSQETVNLRIYQLKDNNYTYLRDITDDQWELIETTTLTFDSPTEPTSSAGYSFDVTVPQTNLTGNRYKIEADLVQPSGFVVTEGGAHSCSFDIGAYSNGVCKGGDGDFYIFLERQKPEASIDETSVLIVNSDKRQYYGNSEVLEIDTANQFNNLLDINDEVSLKNLSKDKTYSLDVKLYQGENIVLQKEENIAEIINSGMARYTDNGDTFDLLFNVWLGDIEPDKNITDGRSVFYSIVSTLKENGEIVSTHNEHKGDAMESFFLKYPKSSITIYTNACLEYDRDDYHQFQESEQYPFTYLKGPNKNPMLYDRITVRGLGENQEISITSILYKKGNTNEEIYRQEHLIDTNDYTGYYDNDYNYSYQLYMKKLPINYDVEELEVGEYYYKTIVKDIKTGATVIDNEDGSITEEKFYIADEKNTGRLSKTWSIISNVANEFTEPLKATFEISYPDNYYMGDNPVAYYKYSYDDERWPSSYYDKYKFDTPIGFQEIRFENNKATFEIYAGRSYDLEDSGNTFETTVQYIEFYGLNPDIEYTIKEITNSDWKTYNNKTYQTTPLATMELLDESDTQTLKGNEWVEFINIYKKGLPKDLKISKEWIDDDASTRPSMIAYRLRGYVDGEELVSQKISFGYRGDEKGKPISRSLQLQLPSDYEPYSATFENLPTVYNGKEIEYVIDEPYSPNYRLKEVKKTDEGFTLVNEYNPPKTTIALNKELVGKSDKEEFGIYILPITKNYDSYRLRRIARRYTGDNKYVDYLDKIYTSLKIFEKYDETSQEPSLLYPITKLVDIDFIYSKYSELVNAGAKIEYEGEPWQYLDTNGINIEGMFSDEEKQKLEEAIPYFMGLYAIDDLGENNFLSPYGNWLYDCVTPQVNDYRTNWAATLSSGEWLHDYHHGPYIYIPSEELVEEWVNKAIWNNKIFYTTIKAGETKTIELPTDGLISLAIIEEDSEGIREFEPIFYNKLELTDDLTDIKTREVRDNFTYTLVNRGTFTPKIINTTAKIGEELSTEEKEVEYNANDVKTVDIADTVEFEGLDKDLTYIIESTLYRNGEEEQIKSVVITGLDKGSEEVVFTTENAGTFDIKTDLLSNGEIVFTHNGNLEDKSERVKIIRETIIPPLPPAVSEHTVKISKTDLGNNELAGAKITVNGDNFTETWISETTPHELVLEPGVYTMVEEVAPEGYEKVETEIKFTVNEEGSVDVEEVYENGELVATKIKDVVVLKNRPVKVDELEPTEEPTPTEEPKTVINVEVVKYAEDTKLPLKDAEITIFTQDDEVVLDINGNECIALTDEEGKAIFQIYKEDYPSVYVQETKAPEGYRINENKFDLDTSVEIINVSVDIYDTPITSDEPSEEPKPTETPTPSETPKPTEKPKPTIASKPDMPEKPSIVKETPKPQKTVVNTSDSNNTWLYGSMFIGSLLVILLVSLKLIKNKRGI